MFLQAINNKFFFSSNFAEIEKFSLVDDLNFYRKISFSKTKKKKEEVKNQTRYRNEK